MSPPALACIVCVIALSGFSAGTGGQASRDDAPPTKPDSVRQWISLQRSEDILWGEAREGIIRMVAIHAPGESTGNLIVRQIDFPDEACSILISSPSGLPGNSGRVTLFVRGDREVAWMFQYREGEWSECSSSLVKVAAQGTPSENENLFAYTVEGLGLFHLFLEEETDGSRGPLIFPALSAHGFVGGDTARAFWHLGWSILLLMVVVVGSTLAHRIQVGRE